MDHELSFNGATIERTTAAMASAPPTRHAALTLAGGDIAFQEPYPRVLFVGGAGALTVTDLDGNSVTYTVPAGYELAGFFKGVVAATTDATNIIARW